MASRTSGACQLWPRGNHSAAHPGHAPALATFVIVVLALAAATGVSGQAGDVSDRAAEQTARALVEALNADDLAAVGALFDFDSLADAVGDPIFEKASDLADFKRGFLGKEARERLMVNLFSTAIGENARATYLKILDEEGQSRPLVRIAYGEGGVEYAVLHLTPSKAGGARIADIYTATNGSTTSESMRNATQLVLVRDRSRLARLLGLRRVHESLVTKISKVGELRRRGDVAEAYQVYLSMPEEVRQTRTIQLLGVRLAQSVNDEAYLHELSQLVHHHPDDEALQFVKIDYDLMTQDPQLAIPAVDRMIERFGEDGALLDLKANIANMASRPRDALAIARRAIAVEPEYEEPYWTVVSVLVEQRRFADALPVFETLEREFGYVFSPAAFDNDFYSEFAESDAYAQWMARRATD